MFVLFEIETLFEHLQSANRLQIYASDGLPSFHETIIVESNRYAISFDSDLMTRQGYISYLKKVGDKLPSVLLDTHRIHISFIGQVLGWSDYPFDKSCKLDWLITNIEKEPKRLFDLSEDLFLEALEIQKTMIAK